MRCGSCGRENREGAAFCDGCGSSLAARCSSCTAELRADARFCDSCGAAVAGAAERPETPAHLAQKILRDRASIEGERRTVTVLFADAKGFTPFSERRDAEVVYGFIQGCVERMVEGVHAYEGTVTQFTGDGIVALFGAPIAHEDSSRRATAAALEIQAALSDYIGVENADTSFRIGLNTGPVVVGRISDDLSMEYTAVGDTTNLAARMEQMAEPGSVYLTESTYLEVADYFDCEDLGSHDVKGKAEPVHVYKAVREKAVRSRMDASVARGLSPFVGRDRDIGVLEGLWKEALAGRGQIVLISGEPGIGKSRLLLEFHRALGDEVIWREAHCVSYGENIPYLPVVELVKSGFHITDSDDDGSIIQRVDENTAWWTPEGQKTVPYLKFLLQVDPGDASVESMGPLERRAGILDALRALILERARVAPRVVVVEDLHWADDQSEEAFRVCADVVAASPVLMILTFRPGYLHPSADMPHAHRIFLGNLDEDARRELANATLEAADLSTDLATPVTDKAEGNPLFIEEVAKALAAGVTDARAVPNSLQDVILARIDRLEVEARGALQLASVIGREFTLRLLNRISDLQSELEGVLGELKGLELIYEKTFFPELAYMFKHALTHDVAYSTLLVERRKALHAIVAAAIEELYADRVAEHYETLAHHYAQAESWEKALDYLERSGDKSSESFSNQAALDYYARALELCVRPEMSNPARAAMLAEKQGFLHFGLGQIDESIEAFDRMLVFAREIGDKHREGAALARRAMSELLAHKFERAEATALQALQVGRSFDDVHFFAAFDLAMLCLISNRHDEATHYLAECEPLHLVVDDAFMQGMWGEISSIVPHWKGAFEEAITLSHQLDRGHLEYGTAHEAMANLGAAWVRGLALGGIGRYDEAFDLMRQIITKAERIGDVFYRIRSLNSLGWLYIELQDFDHGLEWNERALAVAGELGIADPELDNNARLNLGDALIGLDRLDEAEELFKVVERVHREPAPSDIWMLWRYGQHLLHSYGELLLLRGDHAKAGRFAQECVELAERSDTKKNVVKARRLMAQVHAAEGRHDEAEHEFAATVDLARALGNPTQLWKTLAAAGRYEEAAAVIDTVAKGLADTALGEIFLNSRAVQDISAKLP